MKVMRRDELIFKDDASWPCGSDLVADTGNVLGIASLYFAGANSRCLGAME